MIFAIIIGIIAAYVAWQWWRGRGKPPSGPFIYKPGQKPL